MNLDHKETECFLFLTSADAPIGCGVIRHDEEGDWITGGLVPHWRGMGFGRNLFEAILKKAKRPAMLEVRCDNERARILYDRLGFKSLQSVEGIVTMVKE